MLRFRSDELVAPRSEVEDLQRAVERAARSGRIGDGNIFFIEDVCGVGHYEEEQTN